MAQKVDAVSVVEKIISNIVEDAWRIYKVEAAWNLIGEDDGSLGDILTKIRKLEEAKVSILERDRKQISTTSTTMTGMKEMFNVMECREHTALDAILETVGIPAEPPVENWEEAANADLDQYVENNDEDAE